MENLIAIIKNNVVERIIVASDDYANFLQEETVNVTGQEVGVGWGYVNNEFIHPLDLLTDEERNIKKSEEERQWRDAELSLTDWIVPITDHPQHATYLTYRQELRDYPSQADFPNGTRPQKP